MKIMSPSPLFEQRHSDEPIWDFVILTSLRGRIFHDPHAMEVLSEPKPEERFLVEDSSE